MDYKSYILCGLIAIAMIVTVTSKPAPEERVSLDDDVLQNDQDYDYGDSNMPADQVKSTVSSPKSTMLPYFDAKIIGKSVKPSGDITLQCPVNNLADTNVVLWFKGNNTITNNQNVLNNNYNVTKNYSLIIKNATEAFAGNYYCEIAPQKIRMQTILKVSEDDVPSVPTPTELPQVKEAATASESAGSTATVNIAQSSLISLVLVSNILIHRKCFQSLYTF